MPKITVDNPSVQSYLNIIQSIINRMAGNSSSCKTWCITIVSAIIVVITDKGKPEYIYITSIPIFLFFLLDSYYLSLEKHFRFCYNTFLSQLHRGKINIDDIFLVSGPSKVRQVVLGIFRSCLSISIWPFYGLLVLMLIILRYYIFINK